MQTPLSCTILLAFVVFLPVLDQKLCNFIALVMKFEAIASWKKNVHNCFMRLLIVGFIFNIYLGTCTSSTINKIIAIIHVLLHRMEGLNKSCELIEPISFYL